MFCRHCGKELADDAFMCPACGSPTGTAPVKNEQKKEELPANGTNLTGLSLIAFVFALLSFVTGIIFGAFFFVYANSAILLYVLSATTILPAFAALAIGAYTLCALKNTKNQLAKSFAITATVLAAVVALFLFLAGCLLGTDALYNYGSVIIP